jgi:hypothetical protein
MDDFVVKILSLSMQLIHLNNNHLYLLLMELPKIDQAVIIKKLWLHFKDYSKINILTMINVNDVAEKQTVKSAILIFH